jgi:transcriptional regulator with XRE-family HTH domain
MKTSKTYKAPSNRIKIMRESQGYSQEYVATKLNLSQQAYSNLEKNPDNVSIKRIKELAEILSVPLTSIIGEEDTYIQQNFQQQGGQASTVMHVQNNEHVKEIYERYVKDLKEEIQQLRYQLEFMQGLVKRK